MSSQNQEPEKKNNFNRRQFIRRTAAAAAAAGVVAAPSRRVSARGANERLGVGFIGCGGRAGAHLSVVSRLKKDGEKVDLVAACDAYRPRMKRAMEKYKIEKGYMDHRELLADPKVDVVCIATPDHLHGYQALDAVKAGKDVYCEKPVTHWSQFDLTKRLHKAVLKSDSVFQLGSQGMSDSAWHQMGDLIRDGLIGQPIHVECGYFRVGDWGERGMRIDDINAKPGADLNWEAFLGDRPKRPFDVSRYFRWRMYEDYAGGPSTDLFPHTLTPVLSMLNVGMPSLVVATGGIYRYSIKESPDTDYPHPVEREVPDTFNMLIDYPERLTIAVLGTQANNFQTTGGRGAGGRIPVIRGWDGTLTIDQKDNTIAFTPVQGSKKKSQKFEIEHGESMNSHWKNLLDSCRTRNKKTNSPMGLAYRVQTTFHMAMLGHRAGKVAKFDPKREKIVL